MTFDQALEAALRNIAQHGDTDIFPFPFENLLFRDCLRQAKDVLVGINKGFDGWLASYPPQTIATLAQVGYTGFRWATLIDPFWNAYYLALVISIAEQIEQVRIPEADGAVFSYRYSWQGTDAKLFRDSTWVDFRRRCLELSSSAPIVVQTDIADFYPRIYHHRIENALQRLPNVGDTPKRIMDLLQAFTKGNVSYGLPIGGPASRILAELALNGVDTLLVRQGVKFCRYADDYAIFCVDKADAYRTLVFLAEKLANEGLVLCARYESLYRAFSGSQVEFCPRFSGAGFIDSSEGDLAIGDTLVEVKTTTRQSSGRDLRQLFIYLALDALSAQPLATGRWSHIALFNPRRGTLHRAEVDSLILRLSGGKPRSDVLAELIAFAESNEPTLERQF